MLFLLNTFFVPICRTNYRVSFTFPNPFDSSSNQKKINLLTDGNSECHTDPLESLDYRIIESSSMTFTNLKEGKHPTTISQECFEEISLTDWEVSSNYNNESINLEPPFNHDLWEVAGIEWRILLQQAGQLLLISNRIIDKRRFDIKTNLWVDSEIRDYLNGEFYYSLPEHFRSMIIEQPSMDKIFMLDINDAEKYFNVHTRVAFDLSGNASWWWLSSPGESSYQTANVNDNGSILSSGRNVTDSLGGIRPVVWINLLSSTPYHRELDESN